MDLPQRVVWLVTAFEMGDTRFAKIVSDFRYHVLLAYIFPPNVFVRTYRSSNLLRENDL